MMKTIQLSVLVGFLAMTALGLGIPQSVEAAKTTAAETSGEYMDDALITTKVKTNILKEKGLSSMQISVDTKEGVVVLSGTTNSAEHAQLAAAVAQQTHGVKQVVNNLQVMK